MMVHPNRHFPEYLGRAHPSTKAAINFRDIVDVEKARALPVPAVQTVDWTTLVPSWPMFANDRLGDCTCAGAAHAEQIFAAAAGVPFTVSDQDVLRMYEASGYKPGDPSTDQGWTLEAAAGYLRTTGLQGKPNVIAYADVPLGDEEALQVACELFGGLYIGAAMPESAQTQFAQGQVWTVANGGNDAGSWGGHCMWRAKSVLNGRIWLVTWGTLHEADPSWEKAYVDEQMAFIPADWQSQMPARLAEAGIVDFSKLDTYLNQLTGKEAAHV